MPLTSAHNENANRSLQPHSAGRRLAVLLAKVLVAAGILLASWYVSQHASLETLRTTIAASGALSAWVYLACWVVLPAFLFPVPVLALAGGALFGVVKGTLLTLVGALLNAAFMYVLARFVAKDFVTRLVRKHVGASLQKRLLTTNQWQLGSVFFMMRLIPLVSYNMANYVAGITNIRFWVHMLETFLGIIPGTVIFLNMGDKLYQPGSTEFWIAIALLAVLIIVPLIIARAFFGEVIHERKHHNSNP